MSTVEILRNYRVFNHFTDSMVANHVELASTESYQKGENVYACGDPSTKLYLLLKGPVRLEKASHYGPLVLAHVRPGDWVGEVGYIDGKEHGADAVAETDVELLAFDVGPLGAAANEDPAFALSVSWAVWKSLSGKLRYANNRLAGFFGKDSESPADEVPLPGLGEQDAFRVGLEAKRTLFREQQLSALEINLLASMSTELKFEPGQTIFGEDDVADALYVVLSGSVMINKYIPGAGEEALAFLSRGDYFGEMALIDQESRSAGAKAHDEGATVLSIPSDVVLGLLAINKVSSIRLLRLFCQMVAHRLRESDEKLYGWFLLSAGQGPS